jgi:hypothetical protein
MNTSRTAVLFGVLVASFVAMATLGAEDGSAESSRGRDTASPAKAASGSLTVPDPGGDVSRPKLDIRQVRVRNQPHQLKVRVRFPGVAETFDFPTGAVSVFLDTDRSRAGAEYGHFMDFWSDYRFAEVRRWRERPTPEWGHSPEGRCVVDAGVRSDQQSRLRWFEYVVARREGCFEAGAVRVAVTTVNTGDLDPFVSYSRPAFDHLTARHAWTDWVEVGA